MKTPAVRDSATQRPLTGDGGEGSTDRLEGLRDEETRDRAAEAGGDPMGMGGTPTSDRGFLV